MTPDMRRARPGACSRIVNRVNRGALTGPVARDEAPHSTDLANLAELANFADQSSNGVICATITAFSSSARCIRARSLASISSPFSMRSTSVP